MNSTVLSNEKIDYNLISSILSSSFRNENEISPVMITMTILIILLLVSLIGFFIWLNRKEIGTKRLLFKLSNENEANNSASRSVASPDASGRFRPAVWCPICNEFVDHVKNLCPHIGKKLYSSILKRRFLEFCQNQLNQQRFQQSHADPNQPTPMTPPNASQGPTNCTIDLDELIRRDQPHRSLDRVPSGTSIDSSEECKTSTPNNEGHRFRRRLHRTETGFQRLKSMFKSIKSGPKLSRRSSGIGGSIRSTESVDVDVDVTETEIEARPQSAPTFQRFLSNGRFPLSAEVSRYRPIATPKIVRRETAAPLIFLHRSSPPRVRSPANLHRNRLSTVASTSSSSHADFLQPDGTWSGQRRVEANGFGTPTAGLRRYHSQPGISIVNHPVVAVEVHYSSSGPRDQSMENGSNPLPMVTFENESNEISKN